jgi:hypothetical protein
MSLQKILEQKCNSELRARGCPEEALAYASSELIPYIIQFFVYTHQTLLNEKIQSMGEGVSLEDGLKEPLLAQALTQSIAHVCDIFVRQYGRVDSVTQAKDVVTKDVATLLRGSHEGEVWNSLRHKTFHDIQNAMSTGNNEERIFLWLKEIQNATGMYPEESQTIGEYAEDAVAHYILQSKK